MVFTRLCWICHPKTQNQNYSPLFCRWGGGGLVWCPSDDLKNLFYLYKLCHKISNKLFAIGILISNHVTFLQGGYAGNAMGFRINSLNKLMDTRANKPRVTLLHYLVGEAEKENQDALNFVEELSPDLSKASKWV